MYVVILLKSEWKLMVKSNWKVVGKLRVKKSDSEEDGKMEKEVRRGRVESVRESIIYNR